MSELTSTDVQELTAMLAATCQDTRVWLAGDPWWQPARLSEAARECDNSESSRYGAWGPTPVRAAYAEAACYLDAAIDCLQALAAAIGGSGTALVSTALASATLDSAAQAWWLLEPGLGARRRVIRSVLLRAAHTYTLAKTRSLRPASPAGDGADPEAARTYARRLGLNYVCDERRVSCETERLPPHSARTLQLEQATRMIPGYAVGAGVSAHAAWHTAAPHWPPTGPPDERALPPDRQTICAAVLAGTGFVIMPAGRALTLLGHSTAMVQVREHMKKATALSTRLQLPTHRGARQPHGVPH